MSKKDEGLDLNQAYRTFQQSHSTISNILEIFMNTINTQGETILKLNQDNIQLRAKNVELEKPVKTPDKPQAVKQVIKKD